MAELALRAVGLTRDFGAVRAVDGLSFDVPRGIVFGFLGPNGSGKTTTIRLFLGLLDPSAGSASVLGFDTRHEGDEIRARCGALLEFNGLYERMTARDNLEFYARAYRMDAQDRAARIRELLEHIGLWDRRDDLVGGWSRGMKQKLAVARALLPRPDLIFLDEPTAGLDPGAGAALRNDLETLARQEGTTIFLTTHHLADAERLCARVAVIRAGKLLAVGSPADLRAQRGGGRLEMRGRFSEAAVAALRAHPIVESATLDEVGLHVQMRTSESPAPLVRLLVERGAEVEEVRRQASLEDAFLALTEEAA